jgi:hypothetical protein
MTLAAPGGRQPSRTNAVGHLHRNSALADISNADECVKLRTLHKSRNDLG